MSDPATGYRIRYARQFAQRHPFLTWTPPLLLFLGILLFRQSADLAQTAQVLSGASPGWLASAVVVQLMLLVFLGCQYQTILRRIGHPLQLGTLLRGHLRRHVIGTVVPLGGPPSVYVFVRFLGRRGVSVGDALLTTMLYSVIGYTSFVLFLVPVVGWLELDHQVSRLVLFGAALLILGFVAIVTLVLGLMRGVRLPEPLGRRLPRSVVSLVGDCRHHDLRPSDLISPLVYAVLVKWSGIALLYVCLASVGVRPSPGTVLVGYTVGMLFMLISPVLQGVGMVELSMTVALEQFGVPLEAALAATLLYRCLDLWFPLLLGLGVQVIERQATTVLESPPQPRRRPAPGSVDRVAWVRVSSLGPGDD